MPRSAIRDRELGPREMAVRLHDVATGLAIGIGLLKGRDAAAETGQAGGVRALTLVEDSLAELRELIAATASGSVRRRPSPRLTESIEREAQRLKIRLELELQGDESWLAPNQAELIILVPREGLRNVRRHAGTSPCQIAVELRTCPFRMTIRDWGAGLSATGAAGSGIRMLDDMAAGMGCELNVASQPGLGTELFLVGPACASGRDSQGRDQQALSGRQPTTSRRQKAVKSAREEAD